jgi:radical SAM superfamily enzyme YgiQ (UPF0313 family)
MPPARRVLGIARDSGALAARLASLEEVARVGVRDALDGGERPDLVVLGSGDDGCVAHAVEAGVPVVVEGGAIDRRALARLAGAAAPCAVAGGGIGSLSLANLVARSRKGELGALRRVVVRSPGGRRLLPAGSKRTAFDREQRVSFALDAAGIDRFTAMLWPAARALDEVVPGAAAALAIDEVVSSPLGDRVRACALLSGVELDVDLDRAMVGDEDWEIEAEHERGALVARFRGDSDVLLHRAALRKPAEASPSAAPAVALLARHVLACVRDGTAPRAGDPARALAVLDACRASLGSAEARRNSRPTPIVLVHPPRFRNAFDELRLPSLAIARLAAYARGYGYEVRIADLEASFAATPLPVFADDALVARFLGGEPVAAIDAALEAMWPALERLLPLDRRALVGFSIVDYFGHFQMNLASCLARLVRDRTSHAIVLGGERDQVDGDRALAPGMPFDWVVDGDGEEALVALASLVAYSDRTARSIPGVWSRAGDAIHRNGLVRSHLAAMPRPDFSGIPLEAYRAPPSPRLVARASAIPGVDASDTSPFGYLPYGFVKGCVAECTFCSAKEHLDVQPPEKSVDELLALRDRHGVRDFVFLDNLVNVGSRWLERFCRLLLDARAGIQWTDSCRPTGISPDLAKLMREAGCLLLNYGAESGSDAVLERMKKGLTSADIRSTLRATHAAGIVNRVNLIAGYLHETPADVDLTIGLVEDLATEIDVIGCFQGFYLFPGMGVDPDHERIVLREGLDRLKTGQMTMAYDEIGGLRWEEKKDAIDASRNRILARIGELGIRTIDKIDEHDLFWLSRRTRDKSIVRALVLADAPQRETVVPNRAPLPPGGQRGRVELA